MSKSVAKRISLTAAAAELGCSVESIRVKCAAGLKGAKKAGGSWTVTRAAMATLRDSALPRIAARQPIEIDPADPANAGSAKPGNADQGTRATQADADSTAEEAADEATLLLINFVCQGRKKISTQQAALAGIAFFKLGGIFLAVTGEALKSSTPKDHFGRFFQAFESSFSGFISNMEQAHGSEVPWDDAAGLEDYAASAETKNNESRPSRAEATNGNSTKR